jgi:hypothetical protein
MRMTDDVWALIRVPVDRLTNGSRWGSNSALIVEVSITWNYTTWLNIAFFVLAGLLVWRFVKTGGPSMLRRRKKHSLGEIDRLSR